MSARTTRCSCGETRPSADRASLAFFESAAPGTQDHVCRVCRFYEVAHRFDPSRVRPEVSARCQHPFEPMTEGRPTDSFYCGCRGFD